MVAGYPDFSRDVIIRGQDEQGNLRIVRVDDVARLQSLMYGKNYQNNQIVPIGVDNYGNLIAIIKGQYGDTLKTVATDEEGKLIVKFEDTFESLDQIFRYSLMSVIDRLELKTTIYPAGKIILHEDFEGKLKIEIPFPHTRLAFSITSEHSFVGSRSLKIEPYKANVSRASITKEYTFFPIDIHNLEVAIGMEGTPGIVEIAISKFFGGYIRTGRIEIDFNSRILRYLNANGQFVAFGTMHQYDTFTFLWYFARLRINFNTNRYQNFWLGSQFFDLSSYNLYSAPIEIFDKCAIEISYSHNRNWLLPLYIDNIVWSIGGEI